MKLSLALLPLIAAAQKNVFGSKEAIQQAADALVFLLQAPGNCLVVNSDLPADAPSKNLAALWIRAAFHDAGTFDPTTMDGGDGSLVSFLDAEENAGLKGSLASKFLGGNLHVNVSNADMIQLGGLLSVTHCGGPNIPFYPGRIDTSKPVSPVARLPKATDKLSVFMPKFRSLGFSDEDVVALVIGSHSMGGIHSAISPQVTNETYIPSDNTPGVFDNNVFKHALTGKCAIPADCEIANDPTLRVIVQSKLMPRIDLNIPVHTNLIQEGTIDTKSKNAATGQFVSFPVVILPLLSIFYAS